MSNAISIAYFDILQILRTEKWSVFWIVIVTPFVMMIFIASVFPKEKTPSTQRIMLDVHNRDTSYLSESLLHDMESNGFELNRLNTHTSEEERQWQRVLVIPEDFTTRVLQGQRVKLYLKVDRSQPDLDGAYFKIMKCVGKVIGNLCLIEKNGFSKLGEQAVVYSRINSLKPTVALESTFAGRGKVIPGGYNLAVPGMIVISITLSCLTYGTGLFATDRRTGILRRLVGTPCLRWEILVGKLCARVMMGIAQLGILLFFSYYLFDFYLGNTLMGWLVCLVPYAFVCSALGILLGGFFRTGSQAGAAGGILSVLMSVFGGCCWPKEVVPDYLNYAGYLFPTAWAIDGLHNIISFGQDSMSLVTQAGVLCVYLLIIIALCVRLLRYD